MAQLIRVVELRLYYYHPDFDELVYKDEEITTLEAALEFDRNDVNNKKVSIDEICTLPPLVSSEWSIVDVD